MKKLFTFLAFSFFVLLAKAQNELIVYGFYKMDDKYSIEEDKQAIRQWMYSKTETIIANNIEFNLFEKDHQGGGPNNAEWNAGTDLYLAIILRGKINSEDLKISMNENQFIPLSTHLIEKGSNSVLWIPIPYKQWHKALREIEKHDYKAIYGEDFLAGISEGYIPSAPLNSGKIIKFDLHIGEPGTTQYFHVAFGE